MFIVTLSNGKTMVEGRDVEHFDACPDGITSMELLMPHAIYKQIDNKTHKRNAVLTIGRFDKYYCAKQAIANVMSVQGNVGQMIQGGQGTITHEILVGIDLSEGKRECLYIELNIKTGDVVIKKFDYDWWIKNYNINPKSLKSGSLQK